MKGVTFFVEYILQNTDIFDPEIGDKFSEVLKADIGNFDKEKIYKLTVNFKCEFIKGLKS